MLVWGKMCPSVYMKEAKFPRTLAETQALGPVQYVLAARQLARFWETPEPFSVLFASLVLHRCVWRS